MSRHGSKAEDDKLAIDTAAAGVSQPAGAGAEPMGAKEHNRMEPGMNCTQHATQQPGEGFWAVAPGCADISEGMVWVAMHRAAEPT